MSLFGHISSHSAHHTFFFFFFQRVLYNWSQNLLCSLKFKTYRLLLKSGKYTHIHTHTLSPSLSLGSVIYWEQMSAKKKSTSIWGLLGLALLWLIEITLYIIQLNTSMITPKKYVPSVLTILNSDSFSFHSQWLYLILENTATMLTKPNDFHIFMQTLTQTVFFQR